MTTTKSPSPLQRRPLQAVLAIGILGFLLAAVGVWWFLRDDAPAEVSLDAAAESVETADSAETAESAETADSAETGTDTEAEPTEGDATATGAADADVTGAWTVDTETGEFDYESATGSFVGFRIEEELNSVGSTTAVGRTGDIVGTITIDGTTVTEVEMEIDLTTITTETSNRDDNVQDALETGSFPTATFSLTEPIELGDAATSGEPVATTASGNFTIHGVTQPVVFDLDAQLIDETIVVVGSTDMVFSDYDIDVPSGGPVISVDDFGLLELQLLFTRS